MKFKYHNSPCLIECGTTLHLGSTNLQVFGFGNALIVYAFLMNNFPVCVTSLSHKIRTFIKTFYDGYINTQNKKVVSQKLPLYLPVYCLQSYPFEL